MSRSEAKSIRNYITHAITKTFHIVLQSRCKEGNCKRASSHSILTDQVDNETFDVNLNGGSCNIKKMPYTADIKSRF